jgi:hypothetical protein
VRADHGRPRRQRKHQRLPGGELLVSSGSLFLLLCFVGIVWMMNAEKNKTFWVFLSI